MRNDLQESPAVDECLLKTLMRGCSDTLNMPEEITHTKHLKLKEFEDLYF